MKNISLVLNWEDEKVVNEVFNAEVVENLADLKLRLSRKKQIVPDLTQYFSNK